MFFSISNCPICGVTIINEKIEFAYGKAGTRAQLYARVCQYVQANGCINQDKALIGLIMQADGFPSEREN